MKPAAATRPYERSSDLGVARPAFAKIKEIRHADELRRQLRARMLRTVAPVTAPWSVGVD